MSSTSPRLGFTLPSSTDSMAIGDLVLASNYKRIDDTIGITPVTSGTRPGSPFQGQTIYETDTTKYMMWSGTAWVPFAVLGNGKLEGYASSNTASNHTAESMVAGMSVTFNAVAGRTYAIIWSVDWAPTAGANMDVTVRLRYALGPTVTTAGTLLFSSRSQLFSNSATVVLGAHVGRSEPGAFGWTPGALGQVTVGLSGQSSVGTITAGDVYFGSRCTRWMLVESY